VPPRMTTPGPAGPRRRAVLAWSGVLVPVLGGAALAGCADDAPDGARAAEQEAATRAAAAHDSFLLLAAYEATGAAHPALAGRLAPLHAQVAQHVRVLAAGGTPSGGPAAAGAHPAVPAAEDAALRQLAESEQRLVDARTGALVHAAPELARLLASLAAAGAGHVLLLHGGARP